MPSERILFDSPLARMGHFACAADELDWTSDNVIRHTTLVFPSVPVRIQHDDKDAVIADRNVVMFYNDGQVYRRGLLHDRGDEAVWISFTHEMWASIAGAYDPGARDRLGHPFRRAHGPSPTDCYLRHRAIADLLAGSPEHDDLQVEESLVDLTNRLLLADSKARGESPRRIGAETARERARTAEEVRELLATSPGEPWTLDRIVEFIAVSPSHLCRLFKRETGQTIHAYLTQLRLREAADAVLAGERDLTALALRVGFSTHSHFTDAFRRSFGAPPSGLRRRESLRQIAVAHNAA